MTVRDVMATVDVDKLAQIYIRLGSTQLCAEDVPGYLQQLLAESDPELFEPAEFALLGITCPDDVCRVTPIDIPYLDAILQGKRPTTFLPQMPDLGATPISEILRMEVCRTNIEESGREKYAADVLRWITGDNKLPEYADDGDPELKAAVQASMKRAVMQYIAETRTYAGI